MNVLFDCERMKHRHVGLFTYCLELGNALRGALATSSDTLSYYVRPEIGRAFFPDQRLVAQRGLHRFGFRVGSEIDLWHGTEQRSTYAPRNPQLKQVLTIHDLNFLHEPDTRASKVKRSLRLVQRNIDRADHLIAISGFVKQDVLANLKLGDRPITVVHNGCSRPSEGPDQKPAFAPDAPFLFSLGVVTAKKNVHVLPRLLVGNDLRLVIAGRLADSAYRRRIMEEAERHRVAERLIFAGPISEEQKRWCYTHCEAFVFPSLAEGFGLPPIEAMSLGRPVFLSRATSLPEIGGTAARYFDSFEPEAMAATLRSGLDDFASHHDERTRALREQAARFSWERCARDCVAIYRSLV